MFGIRPIYCRIYRPGLGLKVQAILAPLCSARAQRIWNFQVELGLCSVQSEIYEQKLAQAREEVKLSSLTPLDPYTNLAVQFVPRLINFENFVLLYTIFTNLCHFLKSVRSLLKLEPG